MLTIFHHLDSLSGSTGKEENYKLELVYIISNFFVSDQSMKLYKDRGMEKDVLANV